MTNMQPITAVSTKASTHRCETNQKRRGPTHVIIVYIIKTAMAYILVIIIYIIKTAMAYILVITIK